jgi:hypothetical protein
MAGRVTHFSLMPVNFQKRHLIRPDWIRVVYSVAMSEVPDRRSPASD